jgi:rhamnose utilization protein RhaD (predicted bifunctional aldolase and dehydrogenase)
MMKGCNAMTNVSSPTTLAQLVARSRKLGADRSICNWGGGNTSAKADEVDFRGCPTRILWVKGSGSDLANVTQASRRPGFGLAREVGLALRANPHARLVILAKHGLITWGETDESCYASTMTPITNAREFVEARIALDDKAIFVAPPME